MINKKGLFITYIQFLCQKYKIHLTSKKKHRNNLTDNVKQL